MNTKFPISLALVEELVQAQFPSWAGLPIRPVKYSGWDNKTFHLGESMSIRLPSAAPYADQVKKEQEWLPRLAPHLPLPIPNPLAMGKPTISYPWHWSIYQWLEGGIARKNSIANMNIFATDLAHFLRQLQSINTPGAPSPGDHNFHRGGQLMVYDQETRDTVNKLEGQIDTESAMAVWEAALLATWNGPPVWVHGDIYPTNMLVNNGRLCAVIDFGCSAVGDPACDLMIAWSFFDEETRETFRRSIGLDAATWARARGWALWKALLEVERNQHNHSPEGKNAHRTIKAILSEHIGLNT